jgi:hypothetical protein
MSILLLSWQARTFSLIRSFTITLRHTHSVGLLRTRYRAEAESFAFQNRIVIRQRNIHISGGNRTPVLTSERPQTHALDRAATEIACSLWSKHIKCGLMICRFKLLLCYATSISNEQRFYHSSHLNVAEDFSPNDAGVWFSEKERKRKWAFKKLPAINWRHSTEE